MLSPLPCLWKDREYQTLGAVIVVRILTDDIAGVSELPGESQLLQQRVIWTKGSFAAERAGICMPLHILLCLLPSTAMSGQSTGMHTTDPDSSVRANDVVFCNPRSVHHHLHSRASVYVRQGQPEVFEALQMLFGWVRGSHNSVCR